MQDCAPKRKRNMVTRILSVFVCLSILFGSAFSEQVLLPSGTKTIEDEAFRGDTSLEEVILPSGITTIGKRAFADSSLKQIYLPSTLESISEDAFSNVKNFFGYGPEDTKAAKFFSTRGLAYVNEAWFATPEDVSCAGGEKRDEGQLIPESKYGKLLSLKGGTGWWCLSAPSDGYYTIQAWNKTGRNEVDLWLYLSEGENVQKMTFEKEQFVPAGYDTKVYPEGKNLYFKLLKDNDESSVFSSGLNAMITFHEKEIHKEETKSAISYIMLNKEFTTLTAGGATETLKESIYPADAPNKEVTWTSSDSSVVSVENGILVPKTVGTATITVKTTDGGHTATCEVKVIGETIAVSYIALNKETTKLKAGGATETLTASVYPENSSDKNVTWISSNTSVVTVENGVLTPKATGSATITVKTVDGDHTATCEVTVTDETTEVISVMLNQEVIKLTAGGAAGTLVATIFPEDASNKNVIWSTSNPSVVTVDGGNLIPKAMGEATITVKTVDGEHSATCEVKVVNEATAVDYVILNEEITELTAEGEAVTLFATIFPDDATNKNVSWSTSDPAVVTVSDGRLIPRAAGKATITVTTDDGEHTATCEVTVKAANNNSFSVVHDALSGTTLILSEHAGVGDSSTLEITSDKDWTAILSGSSFVKLTEAEEETAVVADETTASGTGNRTQRLKIVIVKVPDDGKTSEETLAFTVGDETKIYTIRQTKPEVETEFIVSHDALSGTTLTLSEDAGVGDYSTLQITSNKDWTAKLSSSSFVKFVKAGDNTASVNSETTASGAAGQTLALRVAIVKLPLEGKTSTATLTFTVGGETKEYTIEQTKPEVETEFSVEHGSLSGTTLTLSEDAGVGDYSTLQITSNKDWTAKLSSGRFVKFVNAGDNTASVNSETTASGTAGQTLKLRVAIVKLPLEGETSTATLTFTVDGETKKYTIEQTIPEAETEFSVEHGSLSGTTLTLSEDAGVGDYSTLQITSNKDWTAKLSSSRFVKFVKADNDSANIKSKTSASGTAGDTLYLRVQIVMTPDEGKVSTATLTFTVGEEKIKYTIKQKK